LDYPFKLALDLLAEISNMDKTGKAQNLYLSMLASRGSKQSFEKVMKELNGGD
jgi:hypothetical protein